MRSYAFVLSLFAIPRAFEGHAGVIQENAIRSWARLGADCEILLCGDDPGVERMAAEVGARWLPRVARNERGTPRLDSTFGQVAEHARHDTLCYVNADIILLDDLLPALARIPVDDYLASGRRWELDVSERLDFADGGWQDALRARIRAHGTLQRSDAMDLFVFRRDGPLRAIPPFVVGRPGWDHWMILRAVECGLPVVDLTGAATLVHQRHDYAHVPDGRRRGEGPEGDANRALLGGDFRMLCLDDASHQVGPRGMEPVRGRRAWRAAARRYVSLHPWTHAPVRLLSGRGRS